MNKLDEVINGMTKLNESLERIASKQYELEKLINVKNKHDEEMLNKIEQLTRNNYSLKEATSENDKLIKNLILPTLEIISKFLYHSNGTGDVDFKYQIETKRKQIDLVLTSKKDFI